MISTFINMVLIVILATYIVVDIKKIKSDKEVIKAYNKVNEEQKKANGILDKDVVLHKEHIEEHRLLKNRLDTVNRKLTIVNKYNNKKY